MSSNCCINYTALSPNDDTKVHLNLYRIKTNCDLVHVSIQGSLETIGLRTVLIRGSISLDK